VILLTTKCLMDVLECVTGFCFDNVLIYGRNVLREGCWWAMFYCSQFYNYNLGHNRWKNSFYMHFAPPHPCAMLTKHFHLTQVFILPFSNIGRGNGGAGTYSLGITVMSLCFWHFPTQFVHGCLNFHIF